MGIELFGIEAGVFIVSTSDITNLIINTGFKISDYCSIKKMGKAKFTRKIWVCEKNE